MYPPTNIQIDSYIPGYSTTILPLSHTTHRPPHPASQKTIHQHTLTHLSTHPRRLTPTPSNTPSFTISYSTSRHRRVSLSSETYIPGAMSSCASSAPARERHSTTNPEFAIWLIHFTFPYPYACGIQDLPSRFNVVRCGFCFSTTASTLAPSTLRTILLTGSCT